MKTQEQIERNRIYQRQYYKRNKAAISKRAKRFYAKNRERILKTRHEKRPPEVARAYNQKYYRDNYYEILAQKKEYGRRNRKKIYTTRRRYRLSIFRCKNGCDTVTERASGLCWACSMTYCRICGKRFKAEWEGQTSHQKCKEKRWRSGWE
jgi:hypothetical protein